MMRMEDIEEKERKEGEENVKEGLGREVAGAGAGELVGVDEESSVRITGVDREHPMVDVLLGTLGLVAGGQESAGTVRENIFHSYTNSKLFLTVWSLLPSSRL